MERLGTSWFGAIVEYEGVLVEDTAEFHQKAWLAVADEFGLPKPLGHLFRRIKGVRNEQVGAPAPAPARSKPIAAPRARRRRAAARRGSPPRRPTQVVSSIFNWTRNPATATKIARRKEEVYEELLGGLSPAAFPDSKAFLDTLKRNKVGARARRAWGLWASGPRRGAQGSGRGGLLHGAAGARTAGAAVGGCRAGRRPTRGRPQPSCRVRARRRPPAPQIPVALSCALPEPKVRAGLQQHGLTGYMDAVITAEDSGAPEVRAPLPPACLPLRACCRGGRCPPLRGTCAASTRPLARCPAPRERLCACAPPPRNRPRLHLHLRRHTQCAMLTLVPWCCHPSPRRWSTTTCTRRARYSGPTCAAWWWVTLTSLWRRRASWA
jgi:hypothetical protein